MFQSVAFLTIVSAVGVFCQAPDRSSSSPGSNTNPWNRFYSFDPQNGFQGGGIGLRTGLSDDRPESWGSIYSYDPQNGLRGAAGSTQGGGIVFDNDEVATTGIGLRSGFPTGSQSPQTWGFGYNYDPANGFRGFGLSSAAEQDRPSGGSRGQGGSPSSSPELPNPSARRNATDGGSEPAVAAASSGRVTSD
ncbi:unnamed protein product [Darwinula stevensoni]|uniref:Uncharacterized protein n=1 Tax=Darwinula stevensoni TaxID=69355 RepID=A0A7R8WYT0_9CRUS|nr:unnamed protein product [Darwinula stevensoni]CAG0879467.1 unnamed protein product [Darwinula stevensoni]